MSLITETNQQYYQGAQGFRGDNTTLAFKTTFDTDLVLGSFDPNNVNYALNNFKLYTSSTGLPGSYSEYITTFTVVDNAITFPAAPATGLYIVVQLKKLDGGLYGSTEAEKAYGQIVEDNYGSYSYITLNDAIDNFMVGYVGDGKLIQTAKKSDVLFFAKRGLQEFSYDTLKSIKSAELTIPASLTLALPQDYVNYVRASWIDQLGVKHIIYPTNNLTISPYYTQIQDEKGVPTQDNFGSDIEGTSITQERWHTSNARDFLIDDSGLGGINEFSFNFNQNGEFIGFRDFGRLYGLEPQLANINGYFNLNEREGKMSFSSHLVDRLIVLEYISDGLAYDSDTRIPKMAEEALYAHILHAIISTRANQPEYVVQRLKKERYAKLRNAKIRLSNIKLDEISQVMRGKSKWIKH
tara:strand:+ start:3267 stop:4496 length:1230 start_codon:yes stop_codon:yes gene_type:complete